MTKTGKRALIAVLCGFFAVTTGLAAIGIDGETIPIYADASAETNAGTGATTAYAPQFAVVDGKQASDGEGYKDLYDGNKNTKYCISISNKPYVTFKASSANTIVTDYTLYTGNDTSTHKGRNPKDWTLYGSDDYSMWTAIHSVTDDATMGAENHKGYSFSTANTTAYLFYKFEFTARRTEFEDAYDLIQLSEIEFTATATAPAEASTAAELKEAFQNGKQAKLTADITLTEDLELYKKAFDLDLNGHVIDGNKKITLFGATQDAVTALFLSDSTPTATHTDKSLPQGGVIACEMWFNRKAEDPSGKKACLYANSGTLIGVAGENGARTSSVYFNSGYGTIDYFGDTMAVFTNGARGCGTQLNGGVYYGEITSTNSTDFSTNVKKVTLESDGKVHATEFVKSGKTAFRPVDPQKEGYDFLGWYKSEAGSMSDFSDEITANVTFKATWSKKVGTFAEFKSALSDGYSVQLTADITLTEDVYAKQNNHSVIDLNGHVISGKILRFEGPAEGTIIDSDPTATHEVGKYSIGKTGAELPVVSGGFINTQITMTGDYYGKAVRLYLNGGTIKKIQGNSGNCRLFWTGEVPSVVGETISTFIVRGGLFYYDQVFSDFQDDTVKVITFKDGDKVYAMEGFNSLKKSQTVYEPIAPTKEGHVFYGWYQGDKKFDFKTVITENITLTAKWVEDSTAPVISGVENDGNYCHNAEVTVSDLHLASVTVNGEAVQLTDGKFTLDMSDKEEKTIAAIDLAGNETEIKVVFRHTFGEWVEKTDSTCAQTGTAAHKDCNACHKHFDTEDNEIADLTIALKAHAFGEWVNEVPATTKQEGVKGHKDCSVCGDHFDKNGNKIADLTIEKLPKSEKSKGCKSVLKGSVAIAGLCGLAAVWFASKKRSRRDN